MNNEHLPYTNPNARLAHTHTALRASEHITNAYVCNTYEILCDTTARASYFSQRRYLCVPASLARSFHYFLYRILIEYNIYTSIDTHATKLYNRISFGFRLIYYSLFWMAFFSFSRSPHSYISFILRLFLFCVLFFPIVFLFFFGSVIVLSDYFLVFNLVDLVEFFFSRIFLNKNPTVTESICMLFLLDNYDCINEIHVYTHVPSGRSREKVK